LLLEFRLWHKGALPNETSDSSHHTLYALLASVIDDLHGTRQYCPTLTQDSLPPSTRFFSTVLIETFDHKLIAITRQMTRCDGNARKRSSLLCVWAIACSIASVGIAVSKALSTVPDSTCGDISENSLSCIPSQDIWAIGPSLSRFGLNRTVLQPHRYLRTKATLAYFAVTNFSIVPSLSLFSSILNWAIAIKQD